jgi:hypothetical protein
VSWASNLNPEDNWDLWEGCQVIEFGGWPVGVGPIKTSSDSNGGDNTQVDGDTLVVGNTQVELSVVLPPDIEDPEPILDQNVDCYVSGLLASFPKKL